MKTSKYLIIIATAFLIVGWTTACSKNNETKNTVANQPAANNNASNINQTSTNKVEATKPEVTKPDDSLSAGNTPGTPTETYKAFYSAKQKKDIEGLKKVLSKDALKFFTMMGDGKTDDGLKQLVEGAQAKTAETRNEKITGDTATLEYLDAKGSWSPMDFVKEDGSWKLTIPNADPNDSEDKKSENKKKDVPDKKQQ